MTPRAAFLCVLAGLFVLNHRPFLAFALSHPSAFGLETFSSLGAALLRLAAVFWLLGVSRAAGARLLRRFRVWFREPLEQAVHETALGLAAVHHALFALGLLGLWSREVFAALLLLGLYPAWRSRPRLSLPKLEGPVDGALWGVLAYAALRAFIAGSAPVWDWDSLAFHLELPRIYARSGAFTPVTWLAHGLEPLAAGLFFVPALAFGQEALAPLTMAAFGGLCCALVFAVGRELGFPRQGLAAAALLAVSPAFARAAGAAGSDHAVGLWAALAFGAAWRGRREGGGWLALAGVFTGLAATTKLSGLLLATALLPVVLYDAWRPRDAAGPALFLAACALSAAPWLLRAAAYTGNPLFPHLPSLFGGDARELFIAERTRRSVVVTRDDALGGSWPLLLPLAALALWRRPPEKHGLFPRAAAWSLGFALCLAPVQANWRYFVPVLPWLYLLAARWADAPAKAAVLGLGLLPALSQGASNECFYVFAARPSGGGSPRDAYLSRRVDAWPAMRRANESLPPGAKVLLYRELRGYLLERPYLAGDPQNELLVPYEALRTPEQLRRHLGGIGITHVLVNGAQQPFPALPDFVAADRLMAETLARHARPLWQEGPARLYALEPL